MTKRFSIIFFAALSFFTFYSSGVIAGDKNQAGADDVDRVVAIVNDDVITSSQLDHEVAMLKAQLQHSNIQVPSDKIISQKVLQQLIDKKLQLQLARHMDIKASQGEIDAAVNRIAHQNKMSVAALYSSLKTQGWTVPEFKREMYEEIIIEKLQHANIASRISISEQEVNEYLRIMQSESQNVIPEYHLQNILIPLPSAPTPNQLSAAQKRGEEIVKKIKAGADFNKLAVSESSGSNSLQGGDLGWRKLAELPIDFAKKVETMKAGDVAGPIQTPNGFHVIKLIDKRAPSAATAVIKSEAKKREVEQLIFQRKMQEGIQNFINELRSQAYIKKINSGL